MLFYVKGGAAVAADQLPHVHHRRPALLARSIVSRHPLGRHGRRRPRIRLRAELVGWRRIRSPVHGQPQLRLHGSPSAGLLLANRPHPPGCRYRHRPRQLPLGRPGRREVLIESDRLKLSIGKIRKGRPRAGLFVCAHVRASSLPAAATAQVLQPSRNNPLMVCTRHWKSLPVLPMFRAYPLASDPGFRGDARLNAARLTRLEMPIMDEVIRAKRQQTAGSGTRAITIRGAREHNLKNVDLEIPARQARGVHRASPAPANPRSPSTPSMPRASAAMSSRCRPMRASSWR